MPVHADLRAELLVTIFYRGTALHDGAVIISGEKITAAGVLLPLSQNVLDSERYGTRHRAAIGISEQTDAVVVVVSEETGSISLVVRGRIERNLTEEQLRRRIFNLIRPQAAAARGAVPAPLDRRALAARSRATTTSPRSRSIPRRASVPSRRRPCARRGAEPMGFLLRNWHLKLSAVLLATVLYTGLVFSGSFSESSVQVRIEQANASRDVFVLTRRPRPGRGALPRSERRGPPACRDRRLRGSGSTSPRTTWSRRRSRRSCRST